MTVTQNPVATGHVPFFITPPGDTDVLFNIVGWFVLGCIIGLGVIFFTIHTLPERMAHRTKKVQLDIVAILCLIALFTNEHIYWIAAMILAFIDLPDFLTPLQRIAGAVESISGQESTVDAEDGPRAKTAADADHSAAGPTSKPLSEAALSAQKGSAHA